MISESKLHDKDKVWIFQSSRTFDPNLQSQILSTIADFTKDWQTHGKTLQSGAQILYNHFIVIWVEEAFQSASGCSVDRMMSFFQKLGEQHHLDLFNRTTLAFIEKDKVFFYKLSEAKRKVKQKAFSENVLFFNNSISSGKQFHQNWKINPYQSWLNR